jgi:hypothetical protein
MGIDFKANSLLAILTVISLIGTFIGGSIGAVAFPIFLICFFIWLIFIALSIARNLKSLGF